MLSRMIPILFADKQGTFLLGVEICSSLSLLAPHMIMFVDWGVVVMVKSVESDIATAENDM